MQEHASPAAIKPMAGPQASCHPARLPHKPYPSASDHHQVSLHEAAPIAVLTESLTVLENTDITAIELITIGSTASLLDHSEQRVESASTASCPRSTSARWHRHECLCGAGDCSPACMHG